MIFWDSSRIFRYVVDMFQPEAIALNYDVRGPSFLGVMGGVGLVRYFGFLHRNSFVIYDKLRSTKEINTYQRAIERIPIVSEDCNDFPESFAIRTKNIELLRELIAQGKKVTWLFPDVYTQAHYLGLLNFHHVVINPIINTHVIYPTGEAVPIKDAIKWLPSGYTHIKYESKIGFHLDECIKRFNWTKVRKPKKSLGHIYSELAANLYNMYSLTYLIWRQGKSNAMTVKKKNALID